MHAYQNSFSMHVLLGDPDHAKGKGDPLDLVGGICV